jgi:hypothetical protein
MRRYIIFINSTLLILFLFLGTKGYHGAREWYLVKQGDIGIKGGAPGSQAKERLPIPPKASLGHSIDYYHPVTEKDLFRPERREYEAPLPSQEEPAPVVEKEIPPPAIELYGVMLEKGGELALLYDKREKDPDLRFKLVSPGTEVQGYTLAAIQAEQVVFKRNGHEIKIELSHGKSQRGGIMAASKIAPTIIEKGGEKAPLAVSVEKKTPKKKPSKPKVTTAKKEEGEETVIINTPFGKLEKKIK